MSTGVRRIRPDERTAGPVTAGMIREEAVATEAMWAGLVRTARGWCRAGTTMASSNR